MQKAKSDSRLGAWLGGLGKTPAVKAVRRAADSAAPERVASPKTGAAKVRAKAKSGKNPMQSFAQLRYTDLSRAFKQAPWRVQVQLIASLAAVAIVVVALGGLYLTEASRAATAGRDVQSLQLKKADLEFAIDRQMALIAEAKSVSLLESRARDLGYVPAEADQIDYIAVSGYYGPQSPLPVESALPAQAPSLNYNESLGSWLAGMLSSVFGAGG